MNQCHWVFIPGGPGLGSSSLKQLIESINLPGYLHIFDVPRLASKEDYSLELIQQSLLDFVDGFSNVILVGHSFGGMLVLSTPQLATKVKGVVLLCSSPNHQWFDTFVQRAKLNGLPNTSRLRTQMVKAPSDMALKTYMMASVDYYATPEGVRRVRSCFEGIEYNVHAYLWGLEAFHPTYEHQWVPQVPTLVLSAKQDAMTPWDSFQGEAFERDHIIHQCLDNVGHFPWLDDPDKVQSALDDFVNVLEHHSKGVQRHGQKDVG